MSTLRLRGPHSVRHRALAAVSATSLVLLAACGNAPKDAADKAEQTTDSAASGAAISVTDVEGRTVEFDKQPERIILGEGRGIFATAALDKEHPIDKIVAMGTDLKKNVPDYFSKLEADMPELADIPEIGSFQKGDVTVENLLSFNADAIVMSKDQYKAARTSGDTDKLDSAGLKYVVVDFRAKPIENTPVSMDVYGKLFGKEKEAKEFTKEWQRVVDMVKERAAKTTEKPDTFVWRAAGLADCCASWNNSNISELVNLAGGHNVADDVLDSESGTLTPEKVIELDPSIVIATGGDWSAHKDDDGNPAKFASAGYNISMDDAVASLNELPGIQPGFELLSAPKNGNLHAIWHQFYNSPFNYLALLQIAQWLHPDEFSDIDMDKEWSKAHEKFAPIDGEGSFFITNKAAAGN